VRCLFLNGATDSIPIMHAFLSGNKPGYEGEQVSPISQ
jgi:hypothetical protein